jgi:hypothetical protein
MTAERWAPIPGYEGAYEVSDRGRVRSLERVVVMRDGRRRVPARLLARHGRDRDYAALWRDGRRQHFNIRELMAAAFQEQAA